MQAQAENALWIAVDVQVRVVLQRLLDVRKVGLQHGIEAEGGDIRAGDRASLALDDVDDAVGGVVLQSARTNKAVLQVGARPVEEELFLRVLVGSSLMTNEITPLLQALNTPGGYNARLREHMDAAGVPEALIKGLNSL